MLGHSARRRDTHAQGNNATDARASRGNKSLFDDKLVEPASGIVMRVHQCVSQMSVTRGVTGEGLWNGPSQRLTEPANTSPTQEHGSPNHGKENLQQAQRLLPEQWVQPRETERPARNF